MREIAMIGMNEYLMSYVYLYGYLFTYLADCGKPVSERSREMRSFVIYFSQSTLKCLPRILLSMFALPPRVSGKGRIKDKMETPRDAMRMRHRSGKWMTNRHAMYSIRKGGYTFVEFLKFDFYSNPFLFVVVFWLIVGHVG
jgi:hypothetical protein